MGHVFGSGIFIYLEFIQYSHVSCSWFFVWVTLFIIYHVDVNVSKGYPGWLFLQTCRPSVECSSLVWEDLPDFHSVGFSRCCCCCIHGSMYVGTSLRCGAESLSHVFLFVSRRPLVICWSLWVICDIYDFIIHIGFQLF